MNVNSIFTAISLLTLLAWAHPSIAQKKENPKDNNPFRFSLGIKGGPNLSWAHLGDKFDRPDFSNKLKLGFHVNGLIVFPMKNNYSFQIEAGFAQKGRRVLSNSDTWENNATYYYGDASLMLRKAFRFYLGENVPSDWFVNVGPHLNYWFAGKGKVKSGGKYKYTVVYDSMPTNIFEPDFNKMYLVGINHWMWGIDFGLGFRAPLRSNKKVLVELRFTSGHTYYGDVSSASNRTLGFTDNLKANEKALNLSVAYIVDYDLMERKKGRSTKDKEVHRKPVKRKRR